MNISQLSIVLNAGQVLSGIQNIQRQLGALGGSVNQANAQLGGMGKGLKSMGAIGGAALGGLAAGVAAIGFTALIGGIISANAEFSKLEAQIGLFSGSAAKTEEIMAALGRVSTEIGQPMDQVTEAFLRMRNLGLDPSREALIAYANVAAGSGKSIMQFTEAVADAATGEFERLKEFGIKAKVQGEEIALTFQGTTTKVANNAEAIEEALQNIGNVNYAGAAAAQAKSLSGQINQLKSNIQAGAVAFGKSGFNEGIAEVVALLNDGMKAAGPFMNAIGKGLGGAMKEAVKWIRQVVGAIQDFMGKGEQIGGVFVTNGDKILGVFQAIWTTVSGVVKFIWDTVSTLVVNLVNYWLVFYKTFKGVFDFIGKLAFTVFNRIVNVGVSAIKAVATAISILPKLWMESLKMAKGFFTGIGAAAMALLRGDFGGIGKAFNDNFSTDGVRAAMGELAGVMGTFGREMGETFSAEFGEATGVVADFGNLASSNAVRNAQNREAAANAPGGPTDDGVLADSAIESDPAAQGETASGRRARERTEDERKKAIEKFIDDMKSLRDSYAPVIKRTLDLKAAEANLTAARALSTEQLAAMGLTLEDLDKIQARITRDLSRSFADIELEALTIEAEELRRGTDAASVAAGRMAEIMRAARDANEDVTPQEEEKLRLQILQNEQLARQMDMRDALRDFNTDIETEIKLLGLVGKQRERMAEILDAENEARENGWNVEEYVSNVTAGLNRLDAQREKFNTFTHGMKSALTEYAESAQQIAQHTHDSVSKIIGSLEDSLTEFFKTGKFNMSNFLEDIAEELARFAARNAVMQFMKFMSGMGGGGGIGGFIGSLFGGFRAEGGPVQSGKSYVVGEKRPELFTPGVSGTITPYVPAGPSGGNTFSISMPSIEIKIEGNTSEDALSVMENMLTDRLSAAVNMTIQAIQEETRYGGTMRT